MSMRDQVPFCASGGKRIFPRRLSCRPRAKPAVAHIVRIAPKNENSAPSARIAAIAVDDSSRSAVDHVEGGSLLDADRKPGERMDAKAEREDDGVV